jgi:hypothetical protein
MKMGDWRWYIVPAIALALLLAMMLADWVCSFPADRGDESEEGPDPAPDGVKRW